MTTIHLRTDITAALAAVNKGRRVRRINEQDVLQALSEARRHGIGWVRGGTVANAYKYPAWTACVAAARLDKSTFILCFGEMSAKAGASPVTWFGPASVRTVHCEQWLDTVRNDRTLLEGWIFLDRAEVFGYLRDRDAKAQAQMEALLSSIPDVVISAEDSLAAGNCPRETERVALAFDHQPTSAHAVAREFPELATFVRKAAVRAAARLEKETAQ